MSARPARPHSVFEVLAQCAKTDVKGSSPTLLARQHGDLMDVVIDVMLPLVAMLRRDEPMTPELIARRLGALNGAVAAALLFPKTPFAAPGSLHSERVACSKLNCHCAVDGELHSATWHCWWDGQRLRREYVPVSRLAEVQAALDRWRSIHPGDGRRSESERVRKRESAQASRSAPHRRRPFVASPKREVNP